MKILLVCGGTGGHIFPAISLAEELKERGYSDIEFVADDNPRARGMIEANGFGCTTINVPKMPYGISTNWLGFFLRLIMSRYRSKRLINGIDPVVVIGFGAYVSGPVILAAKSIGRRIVIHEQNAVMGRTNRLLLPTADKVCFSYENRLVGTGDKYVLTGNPIRQSLIKDFHGVTKKHALSYLNLSLNKKTVLVLGGSGGALSINRLFAEVVEGLSDEEKSRIQIIHITGLEDLEFITNCYRKHNIIHLTRDFYDKMGFLYKAADLMICRAGATTVAEGCFYSVPALYIPYPGAGAHQIKNVEALKDRGAAAILEEDNITAKGLRETMLSLLGDESGLSSMRYNARAFAGPDAAARLAETVEEVIQCSAV